MDIEYYSDILKLKRGGDVQPPRTKNITELQKKEPV